MEYTVAADMTVHPQSDRSGNEEFFVVAHTFAAPFVSETIHRYSAAPTAERAVTNLVDSFRQGIGIYAADAYASADDYHRGRKPLARWRSNKALAIEGATSVRGDGDDRVEIDGKSVKIKDPRGGRVIA